MKRSVIQINLHTEEFALIDVQIANPPCKPIKMSPVIYSPEITKVALESSHKLAFKTFGSLGFTNCQIQNPKLIKA